MATFKIVPHSLLDVSVLEFWYDPRRDLIWETLPLGNGMISLFSKDYEPHGGYVDTTGAHYFTRQSIRSEVHPRAMKWLKLEGVLDDRQT